MALKFDLDCLEGQKEILCNYIWIQAKLTFKTNQLYKKSNNKQSNKRTIKDKLIKKCQKMKYNKIW